eukprot:scaffold83264_cov20-Tisochrysis_lutea.AAC.1
MRQVAREQQELKQGQVGKGSSISGSVMELTNRHAALVERAKYWHAVKKRKEETMHARSGACIEQRFPDQ